MKDVTTLITESLMFDDGKLQFDGGRTPGVWVIINIRYIIQLFCRLVYLAPSESFRPPTTVLLSKLSVLA